MNEARDTSSPALVLWDNPGASVAIAGPYRENNGVLTGRYVLRISHEHDTLSAVLTREQVEEMWIFVRGGPR
jgi:hypothetical protein